MIVRTWLSVATTSTLAGAEPHSGQDSAFAFMKRLSQVTNTKVRDVAARIVAELTGTSSEATSRLTARRLSDLE